MKQAVIERVLDYALSRGYDFAEVFYEDTARTQLTMLNEKVTGMSAGRESGAGIRLLRGNVCQYVYSDRTDEASLKTMLQTAVSGFSAGAANKGGEDGAKAADRRYPGIRYHNYETAGQQDPAISDKIGLLERCNRAGLSRSEQIFQMNSGYLDMDQQVTIANSRGLYVQDRRRKTRLFLEAAARDGSEVRRSYIGPGAMGGFEYYGQIVPEEFARKAAGAAQDLLHARPCPTGKMPVVIAGGFGGLFFHEACGHSLEAGAVADGGSEFSGALERRIASPLITLIDDGTIAGEWGSLQVDDEGTPTRKNVLIENGVLKGYLVDCRHSRRLGIAPTGSARRESYRFAPDARMTNTYIAPGADRPEDMIASIERGLYVKGINAGSVDAYTGEFNFNTNETFLIEHGKITGPVRSATLIGTGGETLKKVEMVGSDFELGQGFCYAGSGRIYIGAGQPSVKISEMTVGGDEV